MSAPRSKRDDASVFRPSRLLVRRTDAGLKYALSNATVACAPDTSDAAPPMTPATACGAPRVGDHQHVGLELPLHAVERRRWSRRRPRARIRSSPRERREVEGVHRLAELEQHVVGDVDDVADRAHAGGLQAAVIQAGDGAACTSATAAA